MKIKDHLNPLSGEMVNTERGVMFDKEKITMMLAGEAEYRPQQIMSLTEKVKEARRAFEEAAQGIGAYQESFRPAAEKMINDARLCRMTMASELNAIKSEYLEIQKFIGSPNYKETISSLRELLELLNSFVKMSKQEALPVLLEAVLSLKKTGNDK